MTLAKGLLCAAALCVSAPSVHAQEGPEQIEQLEPDAGAWQVEYQSAYRGGHRYSQRLESQLGNRRRGGVQPAGQWELESLSASVLYRVLVPDRHSLGLGLVGVVSVDRAGRFAGGEVRAIVECRRRYWWLQANGMVRGQRQDGEAGMGLTYVASVQRGPAPFWYGLESSGRAARLSGDAEAAPRGQHYIGPSLTYSREDGPLEVSVAWMVRVAGQGAPSGPRAFVQLNF